MLDERYMRRAIELAKQGQGWAAPNPMVGAVVVKEDRVIGEGYHQRCGEYHAERNALASCSENPAGATLYVTLEPCCHTGRTPPCTEAILEAGIAHVVIGSRDPNPQVSGGGINFLNKHGIAVTENCLREECDAINKVFFHYITTKTPYVAMKYAMTADGKIATYAGLSKWITGRAARDHVQRLRHQYMGIMVGIGTILVDDPLLNCHINGLRHPIRIICDSNLQIPLESQICRTAKQHRTIIACGKSAAKERQSALEDLGITVLRTAGINGKVDLSALITTLGGMEIDGILLEGGGTLNAAMLRAGLVQKVYCYIAPKLFGGQGAKTPVEGQGVSSPAAGIRLSAPCVSVIGDDLLLEYEVM